MNHKPKIGRGASLRGTTALIAVAALIGLGAPARAYTFNTSPDWDVELDTNLAYSIGLRAQSRDPLIANSPVQQNDEYKFAKRGDIITNRIDAAAELSAIYQDNYGLDISVDAWKDFAYNGGAKANPNPAIAAFSSNTPGKYPSYTNYWYNQGVELNNAFVFANLHAGSIPVTIKAGRFTEYWGNALFNGFQAISYGQSPLNLLKAVDAPGTEVKDLFMPRGQITLHAQVTPSLSLGFQYAFEYRADVFPQGGTFLGVTDAFFVGPQSLEGVYPRGHDRDPPNVDGNFGIEAVWQPSFLNGQITAVARQFDDVVPWAPFEIAVVPKVNYRLAYAKHIHLFGLALDQNIGLVSAGFEASIRQNTALNTNPGGDPALIPGGNDGARGNIFNFIANGIYVLPTTPLWQTGNLVAEVAYTRLLAVTHDAQVYDGRGYACSNGISTPGEDNGCATTNEVNANILFDPQWLQVTPGLDVDVPLNANFGILGNGQTLGNAGLGNQAGSVAYSAGIHALYRQKYNITLKYAGYYATPGVLAAPKGSPGNFYAGGSGEFMWNDKGQVVLTLSTSF